MAVVDTEETLVVDKALVVGRLRLESAHILPLVVWPGPLIVLVVAGLVLV